MSSYGRNLEFRVPPVHGQRGGRYVLPSTEDNLPLGVPVVVADGAVADAMGLLPVTLATGAQAPKQGMTGLLLFEHAPAAFAGYDPELTVHNDLDFAPAGRAVQLISGDKVKVVFRNTTAHTFLNSRAYTGRIMVAGLGATPTLAVGDFLTPGVGNDTDGYWAETATAANAWLVVERVDADRQEVEARFNF
jgi:hypothetical protein